MTDRARELEKLGGAEIVAALDELPVHAFLVDRDGVIRWQNAASRAGVGSATGRRWYDQVPSLSPGSGPDELGAVWTGIVSAGRPSEFTLEVRELDGRVSGHEISAAPIRDGEVVIGFFGVASDRPHGQRTPPPDDDLLTPRQREVLELLAEGKSTSAIAAELYLSTTTVRNHIAHVLASLGVHTRLQAIIAGRRAGLIEID